jgi:probable HAF family extracellular repeat protein
MGVSRGFAAVVLASFVAAAPAAAQTTVVDIGTLGLGTSFLSAINDRNEAVGWSQLAGSDSEHAVLWQDGQLVDLGVLPGFHTSVAIGINDHGQIVGGSRELDRFTTRATLWDRGQIIDISPPGATDCGAIDINNRGDIVGSCGTAVLWRNGEVISLGLPPGYTASVAVAINDAGIVVGNLTENQALRSTPFRWADGVMTLLPVPPGATGASAEGINAQGTIVGYANTPAGLEPVIWQGDTVAPLSGTWGTLSGQAWSINDRAEVVGTHFGGSGGFVWRDGTFASLPFPPGGVPQDINNRGVAVGFIFTESGEVHGGIWPKALTRIAPRDPRDAAHP